MAPGKAPVRSRAPVPLETGDGEHIGSTTGSGLATKSVDELQWTPTFLEGEPTLSENDLTTLNSIAS
ncbi:hypothetical protein [Mycobacteroides salmoniphilum]|uniref:hypothetical protein n=1 Tax=Mycobacteroides salmoniphilum TaxID=404941 RepID=UPI000991B609|nr:hypothetical protein [Mycobacteroides salmoniphilum]